MRDYLNNNIGYCIGRKRMRRLMKRMGLAPVNQEPRTTVPHPERKKYPYLLHDIEVSRPNQVWDCEYLRRGLAWMVGVRNMTPPDANDHGLEYIPQPSSPGSPLGRSRRR